jgi:hypothetical protein
MKSLPELQATPLPQLKAIAKDLQITYPKNVTAPKLASILFEAQQPDKEQLDQDEANKEKAVEQDLANAEKQPSAEAQVDAMLTKIADFFGGNLEEDESSDGSDDGFVFAVIDPATGDVIVKGTFAELSDKMDELEKIRAQEAFASAKAMREAKQAPIDPSALSAEEIPTKTDTMPTPPDGHVKAIEDELSALRKLGLRATVNQDDVELTFRGRTVSTTVHQPVHRIIRTAEQLLARQ